MGWGLSRQGTRLRLWSAITLAVVGGSAGTRTIATTSAEPGFQATSQIIDVPAGGNLQQALNQVQPGGTIRLAPRRNLRRQLHAPGEKRH